MHFFLLLLIDETPVSLTYPQCIGSVRAPSSAARAATACLHLLSATTRSTATTAVMRRHVRPPPAAQLPSSATTPCACHACGPATATPTAPMAQTSGPATVGRRELTASRRTSAPPWSSAVAVGSASTAAGSATEASTVSTDRMKTTVVKSLMYNVFRYYKVYIE